MLYLIGLGLNSDSISRQGLESIKKCKKIYLENYTVKFPYTSKVLEKIINKKILHVDRKFIESMKIIEESKKENVALLVYGSPLTATTHIVLVQEAKNKKVRCKIVYNASVLDAVAETGLQLYKFGKVSSIPKWTKNFRPTSYIENIKQNISIKAHSLILIDIGLEFEEALKQLTEAMNKNHIEINKIIVCSKLGTDKSRIFYGKVDILLHKKIKAPFCFVIPGKMHFVEEEVLNDYLIKS